MRPANAFKTAWLPGHPVAMLQPRVVNSATIFFAITPARVISQPIPSPITKMTFLAALFPHKELGILEITPSFKSKRSLFSRPKYGNFEKPLGSQVACSSRSSCKKSDIMRNYRKWRCRKNLSLLLVTNLDQWTTTIYYFNSQNVPLRVDEHQRKLEHRLQRWRP